MSINTNKTDRDFEAEMGPTYTCPDCGCKYKSKFQESQLCLNCRGHLHEEIHAKLKTKMNLTNNYNYA